MGTRLRLDKFLSDMTGETRSKVKEFVRKGRVRIGESPVKSPDTKVDIDLDKVFLDGIELAFVEHYYYMLNKPGDCITSTEKGKTKTVMDIFKENEIFCPRFDELSPVGRLDKDTEGLLLITNDGDLNHKLLSPKNHVDKVYYAELDKEVEASDIEAFALGLELDDFMTKPAKLETCSNMENGKCSALVTISEGKFHQVKRMFEAVGKEVVYLKRISMGSLKLDEGLELGQVRELTPEEVAKLKSEESGDYAEEK